MMSVKELSRHGGTIVGILGETVFHRNYAKKILPRAPFGKCDEICVC
jgi:hypothetical protein